MKTTIQVLNTLISNNKSIKEESSVKSSNSFSAFTLYGLYIAHSIEYLLCIKQRTRANAVLITNHIWLMTSGSYETSCCPRDIKGHRRTRDANVIWLSRESLNRSLKMMARKDLIETEETKRKDRAALESLRTKHNAVRGLKCPLVIPSGS